MGASAPKSDAAWTESHAGATTPRERGSVSKAKCISILCQREAEPGAGLDAFACAQCFELIPTVIVDVLCNCHDELLLRPSRMLARAVLAVRDAVHAKRAAEELQASAAPPGSPVPDWAAKAIEVMQAQHKGIAAEARGLCEAAKLYQQQAVEAGRTNEGWHVLTFAAHRTALAIEHGTWRDEGAPGA